MSPAADSRPARLSWRRVLFPILALLLALLVVEAVASAVYWALIPAGRRTVVETALGLRRGGFNSVLRYRPHPYFNYTGNPEYRSEKGTQLHGELGIRPTDSDLRHKPPGTIRLVALGGSTTYGLYFEEDHNIWPTLVGLGLRETLGRDVEVINAAVPNYTTYEMLGQAAMWLPEFDADYVLLHTGLNDAFSVGFPDEGGPDNTSFRHAWSHREIPAPLGWSMRNSRLARLLGMRLLKSGGYQVGDMSRAMQRPVPPEEELRSHIDAATGKYYRRNLETLVTLIRHAGAEPVLITVPLNADYEQGLGPYYDAVSQAVLRNNRIMAEIARARDVTLVDLYPAMRDTAAYVDAAHVNVEGMRQKAQLVFDAVLPLVGEHAPGRGDGAGD